MKKFEVGRSYYMTSICDSDFVMLYTVTARTAQTVTITDGKKVSKCRIRKNESAWCNAERVMPFGTYSMAPVLTADRVAD